MAAYVYIDGFVVNGVVIQSKRRDPVTVSAANDD